ncbi:MAG: ExeM/NucH family extracellular endonuclease [Anaerolineales bacterium]|nr:ExeM/NucH family extracellular endonuclease [Anaerolineales bacterium]
MSLQKPWFRLFVLLAALMLPLLSGPPRAQAAASSLFFSEYVEGSSVNKAVEIYNGTGTAVDLAAEGYKIEMYFNGSTSAGTTVALTGTLADGDVYVVADDGADPAILAVTDQTSTASFFNGDDAVVLRNNGGIVDVIGQIGFDPGSEWGSGDTSTADNTIQRLATVCAGDANGSDAFDPTVEWAGFPNNTFTGLGSHTASCGGDSPPAVSSTTPTNGASGVALDANLSVTFSEDVTVSGAWFDLTCTASGSHPATVSGGPLSYTLDPAADFATGESCTLTIFASQVADQDGTPDNLPADVFVTFSTVAASFGSCGDPATLISAVQGSGSLSPLNGTPDVIVEGVVVADLQNTVTELSGFYVQEEDADADADAATSEGIFVYDNGFGVDVSAGDVVRVQGDVFEFETSGGSGAFLTELTAVSNVAVCTTGASVTPATLSLPVADLAELEAYESMLVTFPQTLTVSENFDLARFGSVTLSAGRLFNPTQVALPGAPALAQLDLNNRSRIILDDGNAQQNIDPTRYPAPGLSAANTLRSGATVTGLTAVLEQRFSTYRLQPAGAVTFTDANPRTAAPDPVGGSLRVASFNVLNYFNGDGLGGGFPTSRGANTLFEFNRQRDKIISATLAIDAGVVGLIEIENDGYGAQSAIQDLVNGLNAQTAPGTYAIINPGVPQIGTDEIAVGFIYQPAVVTPVGAAAILDSSVDPTFLDTKNRPVLAQTFMENSSGELFTVAVNHLKSKGSDCNDVGDPDLGDGQGNCNVTRTNAAIALANWLATDPTGSGDPDFLIIGDLNSYAMEDPIAALQSAGYTDLVNGAGMAYSYVFTGESGTLDYALATGSLADQVTGAAPWHANADEPRALDYNVEFKSAGQIISFYNDDAYRSSDHDPVVVGLALSSSPVTAVLTPLNAPIVIPPGGGSLQYEVALTNVSAAPVTFHAWVMATLPNGNPYGPIAGPQRITLAAGQTVTRILQQAVPANAPAGTYEVTLFVGRYNDIVVTTDSFTFTKDSAR